MWKYVFVFLVVATRPAIAKSLVNGLHTCRSGRSINGLKEFQCQDGSGCVDIEHICDGVQHCLDASDEIFCLHSRKRSKRSNVCVLPAYPKYGIYKVLNNPSARPGQSFDSLVLTVRCRKGYGVVNKNSPIGTSPEVFCINGEWYQNIPQCVRFCKLDPDPSVRYMCHVPGVGLKICDNYVAPGTLVSPMCNSPAYYSVESFPKMKCTVGFWNYIAKCKAECGRVSPEVVHLATKGKVAKRGELPWHAGIYFKNENTYDQICGGSLLSNNVVASAAHCFWSDKKKLLPASYFAVAIGKLYRLWDNNDDIDAQKSDVKQIKLPNLFEGEAANFQEDIAILILKTPFVYKTFVSPVCLDFDSNFERWQLQPGNTGKIAGWGLTTANGKASPILKVVELPFINELLCIKTFPLSFREYVTGDKFCAGYTNGTALCKGDSGGGLAFADTEIGIDRYYLRGIVSAAPLSDKKCNVNVYSTFTRIAKHQEFINDAIVQSANKTCPLYSFQCVDGSCVDQGADCDGIQNCADGSDEAAELCIPAADTDDLTQNSEICILPSYPNHGSYKVANASNARPGQTFETVDLTVTCSQGYEVIDIDGVTKNNTNVYCDKGVWNRKMPKCVPGTCTWEGAKGRCAPSRVCLSALDETLRRPKPSLCTSSSDDIPLICCTDCELLKDSSLLLIDPVLGILTKTGTSKAKDKCLDYINNLDYPCKKDITLRNTTMQLDKGKRCYHKVNNHRSLQRNGCKFTSKDENPHMALLGNGNTYETAAWSCAGSVISERFILTGAYCLDHNIGGPAKYIALGVLNRSEPIETWQRYKVKTAILYPERELPSEYHDIALVETDREIVFSSAVLPACLHVDDVVDENAYVIGWGTPENQHSLFMNKLTEEECAKQFPPSRLWLENGYDNNTQMCFGERNVTARNCLGSSGGPLMSQDHEQCVYTILGVESVGQYCTRGVCATIFTRISYYVSWIEDIVWP